MHPWDANKNRILIVTKAKDNRLVLFTRQLVEWLLFTPRFGKKFPFIVYMDAHLQNSKQFAYHDLMENSSIWKAQVKFWTPMLCFQQPDLFDLIITLGGDGTLLFAVSMFQSKIPPIMPFRLGSFGFLTPFLFSSYQEQLHSLFNGNLKSVDRMRLCCTVYRLHHASGEKPSDPHKQANLIRYRSHNHPTEWEIIESDNLSRDNLSQTGANMNETSNVIQYMTTAQEVYHILNEVVIDRGPSSNMSLLELFGDDRHLTTVQADGLCIATATGSTAYSLSAGGSLTHPKMQCTLITPISPHALSFRPLMLPNEMTVRTAVPFSSRYTAFCSFDGRNRIELKRGDHIKVTVSPYPVQTFSCQDVSHDWFDSIQTSLHWNVRPHPKPFIGARNQVPTTARSMDEYEATMIKEDHVTLSTYRQLYKGCDEESEFDLMPWTEQETQRKLLIKKESKI